MKKRLILATTLFSLGLVACQQHNPANTSVSTTPSHHSASALTEQNKKIVVDFYEGVFSKHQVQTYSDRYIAISPSILKNTHKQKVPSSV